MIIRKFTAICAAIFLVTISQAKAKTSDLSGEFCGDRYCGYQAQSQGVKIARHLRQHKEKKKKPVQVASIGNEPIGEAPMASGLVAQASLYIGQTARQVGVRSTLWCSAFIRKLHNVAGVDDRAISWLSRPRTSTSVGAIAVMRHHVGIVKGFDSRGNPILISGNHGHRVGVGAYPRGRILAYVTP